VKISTPAIPLHSKPPRPMIHIIKKILTKPKEGCPESGLFIIKMHCQLLQTNLNLIIIIRDENSYGIISLFQVILHSSSAEKLFTLYLHIK